MRLWSHRPGFEFFPPVISILSCNKERVAISCHSMTVLGMSLCTCWTWQLADRECWGARESGSTGCMSWARSQLLQVCLAGYIQYGVCTAPVHYGRY